MSNQSFQTVAPFTGAWIEIYSAPLVLSNDAVAPFTGAWIEISKVRYALRASTPSLPSRERGLKCPKGEPLPKQELVAPFTGAWIEIVKLTSLIPFLLSLPSRERGLKLRFYGCSVILNTSLPSRERGLKCYALVESDSMPMSLPSRERGLKF